MGARGRRPAGIARRGRLREAGVPVHHVAFARGYGRPDRDLRALAQLRGLLAGGRFDLAHLLSSKAGAVGRPAAATARVPWVYSPHCFAFVGPVGRARVAFAVALERALGRLPGGMVLCVAEDERREALRRRVVPERRLAVVHNGSPPCEEALPADDELAAFGAGRLLVGAISVLRRQKGIEHLLAAAPAVLSAVPDARIAVVGDGEERAALEARHRELGLDDRVRFFGFRAPAARQLASLDVYVLPSLWEAFPFGILEALACGVPQVVTAVGGNAEAVADGTTGLVVAPGDPAALADAIVALLRDPVRRDAMAVASRARHAERFGVEVMVRGTAAVYDRAVSARRG